MANEFVARKGLIVSGSTTLSGSLEVDAYVSASSFTGSLDYDNLVNVPEGLVSSSDQINTGSFSGSFFGDGSGLTGLDPFPFTGSAEISGSLIVDGTVTGSFFSGDGSGLTNVISDITGSTTFSEQFVSQSSVLVTHNLSTINPIVQVYDENDEQITPTKIKIENDQQVLVEFASETSGKVVIAKGGHLFVGSEASQYSLDFINETSITVDHKLDTLSPLVQVYDDDSEQVIPQKIKVVDSGSILVEFPTPTSGTIVVAKGGHIIDISNLSYVAQIFTNQSTVSVLHGFGTDAPIVQVYDDGGLQVIPQEVRIIDENSLEVEFPIPISGKVAVSRGGHVISGSGTFVGNFSGSFTGDGSGLTGIDGFPFTGSAEISGSLNVEGPISASSFIGDGSGLTGIDGFPFTGSAEISGSLLVDGEISASSFVGDGSGLTGIDGFPFTGSAEISGSLSVDGTISGSFFSGDGSGLTNITTDITSITTFSQPFSSETSLIATHNLDTIDPIVQVYDENNEQIIPLKIKILNNNQIFLEFTPATSGKVVISKGGHLFTKSPTPQFAETFTSETSITVVHSLDTTSPIVQVYKSNDEQIIPKKIKVIDQNTILVEFSKITSGRVVVAKGGHLLDASGMTYIAQSFTNTTLVSVEHNFNTDAPIVQIYDTNGLQLIPKEVRIIDLDNLEVEFSTAQSGKVAVSKGGHFIDLSKFSYTTQDFINTSSIIVEHKFGTEAPIVQVYDDEGSQILPDDIKVLDVNTVEITFSENYSGKIAVSRGGHIIDTSGIVVEPNASGSFTGSFTATEDILPSVTDQFDIGSPTNRFKDIYLSGSTIFLGDIKLSESEEGTLQVINANEEVVVVGEVNTEEIDNRLDSLETESGSIRTDFTNFSSSIVNIIDELEITDPTDLTDLNNFTSSLEAALTLDGANITANGNVSVTGDLLVQGTQSIFNTELFSVENNIIELNTAGAIKGGILVGDVTSPSELSGSLLWDGTNDYWVAGISGSEEKIVLESELNNYTSSTDLRLDNLETESGSIRTTLNNFTSSLENALTISSSNVVIEGNLAVSGTIAYDNTTSSLSATDIQAAIDEIVDSGTLRKYLYIATEGQTIFSGSDSSTLELLYTPNYLDIFVNGVRLNSPDYTATDGETIILSSSVAESDEVAIITYGFGLVGSATNAIDVTYNPSGSSLVSTNVQAALSEVDDNITSLETSVSSSIQSVETSVSSSIQSLETIIKKIPDPFFLMGA